MTFIVLLIMMSSRVSKGNLSIEIQLLNAHFFENNQLASYYSLSLCHYLTQFQTTIYTIHDNKIDFTTLRPFLIAYQPQSQNYKNQGTPLLKIIFNPLASEPKLQCIIDKRSVIPFSDLANLKQKKYKKSNKQFLVFPIVSKGRIVVGEINIRFTFNQIDQSTSLISSRVFGSTISKNSISKQRKKVFSNSDKVSFTPSISSKAIKVTAKEQQVEEQQKRRSYFRNNSNLHHNLQLQKNIDAQNIKIQAQERPLIVENQKANEICQSKLVNIFDRNEPIESSYDVQVPLSNHLLKTLPEYQQSDTFEEVPEDYRHLFQKICEINRKYAPLERIPSQQELSQQTILVQKKSSNQSFYSLNSDISQTTSNHLAVAQQLLKQLNLYKFGQSLVSQSEIQKQK